MLMNYVDNTNVVKLFDVEQYGGDNTVVDIEEMQCMESFGEMFLYKDNMSEVEDNVVECKTKDLFTREMREDVKMKEKKSVIVKREEMLKCFKTKVIQYCINKLNLIGKKYKIHFYRPNCVNFTGNSKYKDNLMHLELDLHKILLKYETSPLRSNKSNLEKAKGISELEDFLELKFEEVIKEYCQSCQYKKDIDVIEKKYPKKIAFFRAFGNQQNSHFFPLFIRKNLNKINRNKK